MPGGVLGGWRAGTGARVLLLHGGPGLDFGYMDELAEELGDRFELAAYQQRGLAPSTTEGPFEVARRGCVRQGLQRLIASSSSSP